MAYAERTEIAFDKSIAELIGLVRSAGAEQIGQMEERDKFVIGFRLADRLVRFTLPLPLIDEIPLRNGNNIPLTAQQRRDRLEQKKRSRGRALMLVIKAKLESVESNIETLEEAFLANIVGHGGQTVYERVAPQLAIEYSEGRPMALLPSPGS